MVYYNWYNWPQLMQLKGLLELVWSVGRSDGRSVSWLTFVCQTHFTDFKSWLHKTYYRWPPWRVALFYLRPLLSKSYAPFFKYIVYRFIESSRLRLPSLELCPFFKFLIYPYSDSLFLKLLLHRSNRIYALILYQRGDN